MREMDLGLAPVGVIAKRAVQCNLLPLDARLEIRKAALVDPHLPPGASFERSKALDRAILRVRAMYPRYFK